MQFDEEKPHEPTVRFERWFEEEMERIMYIGSEQHIKDLQEWSHRQAHSDVTPPWEEDDDD